MLVGAWAGGVWDGIEVDGAGAGAGVPPNICNGSSSWSGMEDVAVGGAGEGAMKSEKGSSKGGGTAAAVAVGAAEE